MFSSKNIFPLSFVKQPVITLIKTKNNIKTNPFKFL